MTLERAKFILNKKIDFIKENLENENTFDYYWTEEDIEAIEIIFIALENDKNAFIKQIEITQEANSLYEKEKEKNIKLEKEIRELIRSYEHDMKLCNDTDMFEAVESDMYEYGINRLKELLGE